QSAHLYQNPNYQLGYGIPDFYQAYQTATLGVENSIQKQIVLYPNPASDFISLYGDFSDKVTLKIFDVSGKIILNQAVIPNREIPVQSWAKGMYLYQITTPNGTQTGRIIKE
ncbi:MAG: T9SS type A sorting domain-containing protein, partial [Flavobacteriaceae bacterium]